MTKHDVRIRRGSFSKGQIERHRDFKKFTGLYEKQQKKSFLSKLWVVVVAVVFVVAVAVIGYIKISEKRTNNEKPALEQQK
jgi:flagellar biosynthesis/type III secretory pathway M-ring protein FliF/YscJ